MSSKQGVVSIGSTSDHPATQAYKAFRIGRFYDGEATAAHSVPAPDHLHTGWGIPPCLFGASLPTSKDARNSTTRKNRAAARDCGGSPSGQHQFFPTPARLSTANEPRTCRIATAAFSRGGMNSTTRSIFPRYKTSAPKNRSRCSSSFKARHPADIADSVVSIKDCRRGR